MKKININKSDEAALIVEKIIEADSKEVVLIIPRFSQLAESLSNFHLLKREAETIDKKILIESVDNRVVELAELAGIEAINPFFVKNKRQFSDIIPKKEPGLAGHAIGRTRKSSKATIQKDEDEDTEKQSYDFDAEPTNKKTFFKERQVEEIEEEPFRKTSILEELEEKESIFKGAYFKGALGALILSFVIYGAMVFLPKADLKIITKKVDWAYNDSVITQISAKSDPKTLTIANQKFTSTKNTEMKFLATGKKQVADKATGKITIYNSYSSDPQTLIVNTRFLSPEGKIFLLTKGIVVPGAKISEGKILPSSIDANVIAEKAGEEYNLGPIKLFTIPGFKGSPKYNAFYGESKESMRGGFVGEISYPTASDLADATKKIKEALESNLKTTLYAQISSDFKILEGASAFTTLKQENKQEVDKDGNFSIFADAQLTIIAFKEADLVDVLKQRAESENDGLYNVKSFTLEYGIARMDVATNRLSFPINYKAVLSYKIDTDKLKSEIMGKTDVELRKAIFSLPGLDTANISLWPFWVKSVPNKLNKINIAVD